MVFNNQELERLLIATLYALDKQLINFAFCRQSTFPCFFATSLWTRT
ncbi:hypothetical protein CAter10_1641 [Collimonas arenae]|nr:hypothetical protein CAter10_1641 [Collimonas arenae]